MAPPPPRNRCMSPSGEPGDYEFTPFNAPTPPGVVGLFPGWGAVQPWGIMLQDHQAPGPDPLTSFQYALDLHYLKAIGSVDSPWRTAGSDRDCALLGRRRACGMESHRQHRDSRERAEPVEVRTPPRPGELRDRRQLHRDLRCEVQFPVLAALLGDSAGRRRREPVDGTGRRLDTALLGAAVSHPTHTGLPVEPRRGRRGGGGSAGPRPRRSRVSSARRAPACRA